MAINRPTGEQIRFVSTKTGDHILDTYMEMVERGNRTLYELLDDIYDPYTGEIHDDFIQLRIDSSTQRLQIRIGQYLDPNLGWENTPNYILRHRGAWTPSTTYELFDIVTTNNYSYICTTPHTSSTTINTTNFKLLFDADFIENYAIAAAGSASTALSHSNTALSHANNSNSARLLSESARDASQLAQSLSESARNDSQSAKSLSESARDASIAAKSLSESARDKAQKWAEEAEDIPVETGQFSAKHWSAKANLWANEAEDIQVSSGEYSSYHWASKANKWAEFPVDTPVESGQFSAKHWAAKAADSAATATGLPPGSLLDFAGSTPPLGFLLCDGSNVSRATYGLLFAVIGTTFGAGDGSTTFTLPDFRRRVAVGAGGTGTAELGNSVGSSGGSETHTLTQAEMPNHTHTQNSHNHSQNAHNHTAERLTGSSGTLRYDPIAGGFTRNTSSGSATATNNAATATNQATGGGGAHNNMQPSLVVLKIIKT